MSLKHLPLLLSISAGMADLTGFLTLGHLFTAHVTGNLAILAADAARDVHPRWTQMFIVPVFVIAVGATFIIARRSRVSGVLLIRRLLWIHCVLLMATLVVAVIASPSANPHGPAAAIAAMLVVSAMGCQFALVRHALPNVPTTTSMSVNLMDAVLLCIDVMSAPASRLLDDRKRLKASAHALAGFLAGCLIAAVAVKAFADLAWALPASTAALAALACERAVRRDTVVIGCS